MSPILCLQLVLIYALLILLCPIAAAAGTTKDNGSPGNIDVLIALILAAIVYPFVYMDAQTMLSPPQRLGSKNIRRQRAKMSQIFAQYGDMYVRRAYRMKEQSFWRLLDIVEPHLVKPRRKRGRTPNGDISAELRLSMALRYFAGGDSLDIGPMHGVHPNEVLESVRRIVNAIHSASEMSIVFPENHAEQEQLAQGFTQRSAAGFTNCVGAIDGILIWTHKPTVYDLNQLGFGAKKFLCGRKKKFGINMQAICDSKGRFIDYEMKHPGATADYLAFTTSTIFDKMNKPSSVHVNKPFLKPGLCLYGDNAYVNSDFMSVPFKNVSSGPKDAYNFYQSQVRITIECAFGMLVHRFGLLRKPMPVNFTIQKTCALVGCLCKLHNFCINEREQDNPLSHTAADLAAIATEGGFLLPRFDNNVSEEYSYDPVLDRINPLLDGGEHTEGVSRRAMGQRALDNSPNKDNFPSQQMLRHVELHGYERPKPRIRG